MEPNNINNTNTNDTSSINFSRIPPTPPVPPARTKPIKPQNNMKLKKMILALLAVAVVITGGLYLYMQKRILLRVNSHLLQTKKLRQTSGRWRLWLTTTPMPDRNQD